MQYPVRSLKPLPCLVLIAKSFNGPLCHPRDARNTITFFRTQHALLPATLRRTLIDLNELHELLGRLAKKFTQILDGSVFKLERPGNPPSTERTAAVQRGIQDPASAQQRQRTGLNQVLYEALSDYRHFVGLELSN